MPKKICKECGQEIELREAYPREIYIREPADLELHDGKVVKKDIATYYARRGSHWVKYVIADGEQLIYGQDEDGS